MNGRRLDELSNGPEYTASLRAGAADRDTK
jgi:hypothetical protein